MAKSLRSLAKQALSLHRKAEVMQDAMMAHFGAEGMLGGDNATDFSDNVLAATEALSDVLTRHARAADQRAGDGGEA